MTNSLIDKAVDYLETHRTLRTTRYGYTKTVNYKVNVWLANKDKKQTVNFFSKLRNYLRKLYLKD